MFREQRKEGIREAMRLSFLKELSRRDELKEMSVGDLRKIVNSMAYEATNIAVDALTETNA